MRLFAAIVPPREVLKDLTRVVRSATLVDVPAEPRKHLLRHRLGRGEHAAGRPLTVVVGSPELDIPPLELMHIPITGFGNVTLGDSGTLAAALRDEAAAWAPAQVAIAGGTALEFPGDTSVWAKLDGDLDALTTIGRGVPLVVQRLGFFVDRRQFRPWLSVGTITDETTAPYLERLVAALEAYRSTSWTIDHVSLMRKPNDATSNDRFEEMERMPLAGG